MVKVNPAVRASDFEGASLTLPAEESLMDKFHEVAEAFHLAIHNHLERNALLGRTRDLLLPKLVSGEFDVSELDIAVPEEVA